MSPGKKDPRLELLCEYFEPVTFYRGTQNVNLCRKCSEKRKRNVTVEPGESFRHLAEEHPLALARYEVLEKKATGGLKYVSVQASLEVNFGE